MRSYLVVLLTLACASAALAIVCAPDQCTRMHSCPMSLGEEGCLTRGTPGQYEFQPHGGFCGCCSNCVRVLEENERCVALLIMGGSPPTVKCGAGLHCNGETATCVKNV